MGGNYLTREELEATFGCVGDEVFVDRQARFIGAKQIYIGSRVRIDSGALLVAESRIDIGSWVHIGAAAHIFGSSAEISIEDFCGLSSRVSVFSASDDYSEGFLTNPMVPPEFRKVHAAPVRFEKHALIGCGAVVMPGVRIGFGASVGALAYVNKSVPPLFVVAGNPIRKVAMRDGDRLADLEQAVRARHAS